MAFVGSYTIQQGLDITSFTITDTSTGSDPNLTDRQVSLFKIDGSLLGGSIIDWPIANGNTLLITGILDKDYSLNIVVNWISSSPIGGSTYTQSTIVTFNGYSNTFDYSLIKQMAATPTIINDNNYFYDKIKLRVLIDDSVQSTNYSDQFKAQFTLDMVKYLQDNQLKFF